MIWLYFCKTAEKERTLLGLLREKTGIEPHICRNEYGKPYAEGNEIFFNISHSGDICAIAVSDNPVGVDAEKTCGKERGAVLSRLTAREKSETEDERGFLRNWTAKEAYVKLKGARIWDYIKRLEFFGGKLYLDGDALREEIRFYETERLTVAVCADDARFEIENNAGFSPNDI